MSSVPRAEEKLSGRGRPGSPSCRRGPGDPGQVTEPRWALTSRPCSLRGRKDTQTGRQGPSWTAACPRTRPRHAGPASRPTRAPLRRRRQRKLLSVFRPFSPRWLRRGNHVPRLACAPAWGRVQERTGRTRVKGSAWPPPTDQGHLRFHRNLPAGTRPAQPRKQPAKFPPGSQAQTLATRTAGPPGRADCLQTRKRGTARNVPDTPCWTGANRHPPLSTWGWRRPPDPAGNTAV